MIAHSSDVSVPTIDDMSEHELPASIRVALWATAALGGRVPQREVPRRALPDIDDCVGLLEPLELWASLGERVVLAALPRPGDVTGMPRGSVELLAAATLSRECVYVPGVGGALVPTLSTFGPVGDQGWLAQWASFAADPVPTHRVEALDLGRIELSLRTELAELTDQLVSAGAPPFGSAAERGASQARSRLGAARWGVPEGLPPRALRVINLAGSVLALTDVGLDAVTASLDASTAASRTQLLHRIAAQASCALADATNAAALHLAFRS